MKVDTDEGNITVEGVWRHVKDFMKKPVPEKLQRLVVAVRYNRFYCRPSSCMFVLGTDSVRREHHQLPHDGTGTHDGKLYEIFGVLVFDTYMLLFFSPIVWLAQNVFVSIAHLKSPPPPSWP